MFDRGLGSGTGSAAGASELVAPLAEEIRAFNARLAGSWAGRSDAERIDALRVLEETKGASAGAQAAITVDFVVSQAREQAEEGEPGSRQGRGVAAQVGLARRESLHRARRHVGLAGRLATDLTYTFAALRAGAISEEKAFIVARDTECLSDEDRERVDACVAGDPSWIENMGDRELESECQKLAYRFDPHAFVNRAEKAVKDRRVTIRPKPDAMGHLTALLPMVQMVACYAALKKYADTRFGTQGETRSRGQLMADRLVELITGQAVAEDIGIQVGLLISDRTLVGADNEAVRVRGGGMIPAEIARKIVKIATSRQLATLKRIYASPTTGQVVGMDSKARKFPKGLADLIEVRDAGRCRMAWCDAPIRPTDHPKGVIEGGKTSFVNGQGLCEGHNIAKQAPGWLARPRPGPDGRHIITTTTPTEHTYTSAAPEIRIHRIPSIDIVLAGDYATAG